MQHQQVIRDILGFCLLVFPPLAWRYWKVDGFITVMFMFAGIMALSGQS